MKVFFVRHGESEANLLHEFSNRGWKHPLTDLGIRQAIHLRDSLADERIERSFSSPIQRAVQTAETLAAHFQIPVEITPALQEYDTGIYEGRSDEAGWREYGRVWKEWQYRRDWYARMAGGESFWDMYQRFIPFIRGLMRDHANSTGAIVLVSHGGLYRCLLPFILSNISAEFAATHSIGNTEYILAQPDSNGHLVCLNWCGIQLQATA